MPKGRLVELQRLVAVSAAVAATRGRNAKRDALAAAIRDMAPAERRIGVAYLSGTLPQGRIGVGPAVLSRAADVPQLDAAPLSLLQVDEIVERVRATTGPGSVAGRRELLQGLFARCGGAERLFLVRLLVGDVRQGALDGVMVEAIAKASGCPAQSVRRAHMLCSDLLRVAETALADGEAGLRTIRLTVGTPVESMLAQTASDLGGTVEEMAEALLDYKMDGARVQVHKAGADVAVYSRQGNEVTASVPEVVDVVAAMPADALVLDGEVVAFDQAGRPLPFQTTMRRFGRRQKVAAARRDLPLTPYFFDCLHVDGEDAVGDPLRERIALLDAHVPAAHRMPRIVTAAADAAQAFLAEALDAGHEGVMVKDPATAYAAGSRGKAWRKVKPAETLDLVVLAAEWGHGRRRGWLSNLHLGARDGDGFAMLGKTFKGLTDAMLEWQTQALIALEVSRTSTTVFVAPRLVVEILLNEVQTSPRYPAGLALRFARVKRYRPDKTAAEADTLDTVRALHARTQGG